MTWDAGVDANNRRLEANELGRHSDRPYARSRPSRSACRRTYFRSSDTPGLALDGELTRSIALNAWTAVADPKPSCCPPVACQWQPFQLRIVSADKRDCLATHTQKIIVPSTAGKAGHRTDHSPSREQHLRRRSKEGKKPCRMPTTLHHARIPTAAPSVSTAFRLYRSGLVPPVIRSLARTSTRKSAGFLKMRWSGRHRDFDADYPYITRSLSVPGEW